MTQKQVVLDALRGGPKCTSYFLNHTHIARLGSVIFRLRGEGYGIITSHCLRHEHPGGQVVQYDLAWEPE